jgi:isopenicillin N synthase-like dioxygenase
MKMTQDFPLIPYSEFQQSAALIESLFYERGFIAVTGVPHFVETYEKFIKACQEFMALDESERDLYSPEDRWSRGWSYGIESLVPGVKDDFKGSYYARFPNEKANPTNIWPETGSFKEAYINLGNLMHKTSVEILKLMNLPHTDNEMMGRMLYYGPCNETDGNDIWCSEHRDHGMLTALCPAVLFKDGERVATSPAGSGLYVRGENVRVPAGTMLFQMGEVAEMITDGKLTATDHLVKKAYGGFERFTLALFTDPPHDMIINTTVKGKYDDRYRPGITYAEWAQASFDKYRDM